MSSFFRIFSPRPKPVVIAPPPPPPPPPVKQDVSGAADDEAKKNARRKGRQSTIQGGKSGLLKNQTETSGQLKLLGN